MDIKSKSTNLFVWIKLLAVLVGIAGILLGQYGFTKGQYFDIAFQNKDYKNSRELSYAVQEIGNSIRSTLFRYKSTKDIEEGTVITNADVAQYKIQIQERKTQEIESMKAVYDEYMNAAFGDEDETNRLNNEKIERLDEIYFRYNQEMMQAKQELIEDILHEFETCKISIASKNFVYAYTINGVVTESTVTNIASVESLPFHTKITDDTGKLAVYLGMQQKIYDEKQKDFSERRNIGAEGANQVMLGVLLVVLSLGTLAFLAGKGRNRDEVRLCFYDKLYLDFALFAFGLLVILGAVVTSQIYSLYDIGIVNPFVFGLVVGSYLFIALYIVMVSKRLKRSEFIRHTLIFVILRLIVRSLKKMRSDFALTSGKKAYFVKAILSLAVIFVVDSFLVQSFRNRNGMGSVFFLLLFTGLLCLLGFYYHFKKQAALEVLSKDIKKIIDGDIHYKIPEMQDVRINEMARDINNISKGLKNAVEEAVRAQRMKVDLITNVSHDLKTPLTSIISYVDLLSKEKQPGEATDHYLGILKNKSEQLKKLIEDLFEVTKAESGNVSVEMGELSLKDLLTQVLAEFEEALSEKNVSVIINGNSEKITVLGDSGKLWRVFSNIFGNIAKYTQENTRVYVDITTEWDYVKMTVKNIANYEMNFDAGEIAERFRRGDASRTGEGSGLGLAIVSSFMELQGGRSEITVDGDLFKIALFIKAKQ